ncbi:MFS transporter [Nitratireductor soli]|uniref:MFS transporter n=1 Tax=Nitratireductor soli TaxID=1670619 RepID=UPI00065E04CA|nr:MFS transporter [Nitratireductor soli]
MLVMPRNAVYRRLFAAQIIALLGTGLLTVALGLLAYDAAGGDAGVVLGTALFIKMVAYVGLAPVANALVSRLPPRRVLIAMDVVRALVALCLPFVDAVWQIYVLIFVLQAASATFTPTFQALIPEILPDEREYTQALSLSRMAYDLESLASPAIAGFLLTLMSYHWLFGGTVVGFVLSAFLVLSVLLPQQPQSSSERSFLQRLSSGTRIYLATPRLRGLLALNLAAAAAGAMVIVNTVVIVRTQFGGAEAAVAIALAAYGGGSMLAALLLPRVLEALSDRVVMLVTAGVVSTLFIACGLTLGSMDSLGWPGLIVVWFAIGGAYSLILTPSGRLLRKSAQPSDRSAVFAAHFALSHGCWLITYPLAGWLGARMGMTETMALLGVIAATGTVLAYRVWPREDPQVVAHVHTDLQPDDPHLEDAEPTPEGWQHAHSYVIDERHRRWPVTA